jgi:hypothetical protein
VAQPCILVVLAYVFPKMAIFYAICGLYDVSRDRVNVTTLRPYFLGNGFATWALSAALLLLSWPSSAVVHQDFTVAQWERLRDDDRAAYIADFIDTLATMAATQPAQRAARHYSECIMRSQLTARQLADFLREYARARPELRRGSVQHAMNDYLNALCGRPLD